MVWGRDRRARERDGSSDSARSSPPIIHRCRLDQSINPYRGCSHGCVYCFARPTHAYLGLSPGLDFETKLFYKADAVKILETNSPGRNTFASPSPWDLLTHPPLEKRLEITRGILGVLARCRHPVTIVTKSALVVRDIDLLADLARDGLVSVMLSITSLSNDIKRTLEPRTASPQARLRVMQQLSTAGIPVGVLVAPVIPPSPITNWKPFGGGQEGGSARLCVAAPAA
jgi:DNA repair photolyase